MRVEIVAEVERDAFTTLGPTPHVSACVSVRSADFETVFVKGFDLSFGLRPLRIAWRGRWIVGYRRIATAVAEEAKPTIQTPSPVSTNIEKEKPDAAALGDSA